MREVNVLGVVYRVVDDQAVEGEGNEGLCDPTSATLFVDRTVPAARRWAVLRHEIGHAVASESGFRDRMRDQFGLEASEVDQLEEAVVGHFLPALLDTLERAGWGKP